MASKRKEPGHTHDAMPSSSPSVEAKKSKMDPTAAQFSKAESLQRFLHRPFVKVVAGPPADPHETRQEICYDHNYRLDGCLEGRRGRPCLPGQQGRCLFNHDNCHFCQEPGHTARSCEQFSIHEASRWFDFESRKPRVEAENKKKENEEEEEEEEEEKAGESTTNTAQGQGSSGRGKNDEHEERNDFRDSRALFEARGGDSGRAASKPTAPLSEYVFVVGGRNRGQTIGYVDQYCTRTRKWRQLPRMQEPRGSLGAECVGRALLAISGSGIASNLDSCEVLEVGALESQELPETPVLKASGKDVEAKPSREPSEATLPPGRSLASKPANTSSQGSSSPWLKIPSVTIARHALTTTVMPEDGSRGTPAVRVFATGGWKYGNQACDSNESLECGPLTSDRAWAWKVHRPMSTARKLHGLVAHGGRLFAFGGMTVGGGHRPVQSAESYDPEADSWSPIRNLPVGACVSAATARGKIWLFLHGRQDKRGVLVYDPVEDSYTAVCALPLPQWFGFTACSATGAGSSGNVYLVGGSTCGKWSKVLFKFDTSVSDGPSDGKAVAKTRQEPQKPSTRWERLPDMTLPRRRLAAAAAVL